MSVLAQVPHHYTGLLGIWILFKQQRIWVEMLYENSGFSFTVCLLDQRWWMMTTAREAEKPSGHEDFTHTGGAGEAPV